MKGIDRSAATLMAMAVFLCAAAPRAGQAGGLSARGGGAGLPGVDIDIYDDSLDVSSNVMDTLRNATLGSGRDFPAGPALLMGEFLLVHSDAVHDPDGDGGNSDALVRRLFVDSSGLAGPGADLDADVRMPRSLALSEAAVCTVVVVIPDTALSGYYTGRIRIGAVGSQQGDTAYDAFTVRVFCGPSTDLDNIEVFPNPCKVNQGMQQVNFYNLPAEVTVRIYDAAGDLVEEFDDQIENGLATWKAPTAGGLYFWIVEDKSGDTRRGKLSVIR